MTIKEFNTSTGAIIVDRKKVRWVRFNKVTQGVYRLQLDDKDGNRIIIIDKWGIVKAIELWLRKTSYGYNLGE